MRSRLLILIVIVCAVWPGIVRAQQETKRTLSFDGPEVFCHILNHDRLKPIQRIADIHDEPHKTMLIVFGDPSWLDGKLRDFLDRGGSLLVATDHAYDFEDVEITVGKVTQEKSLAYRGIPSCPKLSMQELPNLFPDGSKHPLFRFLDGNIATNCPSTIDLRNVGSPYRPLAGFTSRAGPRQSHIIGSPRDAPPGGRAVFLAGHGVFMNGMMLQPDNDNFAFALNTVRWLREGPDGAPRTQAFFMVDGQVIEDFDMNLSPPLPPPPMPTAEMMNRLLRGWEDERFFHQLLDQLSGRDITRIVMIVFALTSFVFLLYGLKKFMESRHQPETAVPRMIGTPPAATDTGAEERKRAVLRQADYWQASRTLVRDWFQREFAISADRWQPGFDASIQGTGFFWSRWRVQGHAARVLRLANAVKPTHMSQREFRLLIEALRELTYAIRDGTAALLVNGKPVRQVKV
jgi:hypothetical protein